MLAVMSAFPEHPWEVWKFKNKRMRWKDIDSQRAFLESIKSKLGITCFEDWYNVRQADLIECGGTCGLFRQFLIPLTTNPLFCFRLLIGS